MGTYRWVFNKVISLKEREYLTVGKSRTYLQARKDWIAELREEAHWLTDTPAHIGYGAMMDADKAYKGVVKARSKGLKADLPRCKKRTQKTCYVLGNAITAKGIYSRLLGSLRSAEPLPDKPSDSRLLHECGSWYVLIPTKVPVTKPENQGRMVAVDPGVRTFAAFFSPHAVGSLGDGAFKHIVRLCVALDSLLSRASKAPCKRKRKMLQAAGRARRKIRRLTEDMHYQTIGWLCRNFDTIVFPEADFTSAVSKLKRRIGRKSVRSLLGWSFATFRNRLIASAEKKGKNVIIVNEAYTSKTANWTGEIVHNLGGRKTITSRGVRIDRDVNGALGIFLKALLDQPIACYRNC